MSVLIPQTFSASRLADSGGLSDAFTMLESCLAGPDTRLDLILQDLCSVPNLFEFVMSGEWLIQQPSLVTYMLSVWPRAESLVARIMQAYPFEPALIQSSFAGTLLLRLSSVLFALPPDLLPTDTLREIGRLKVYAEDALPVLSSLCSSNFTNNVITVPDPCAGVVQESEYDDDSFSGFFVRKKQRKLRRKNKECRPTIDVAPFHRLGAEVPSSAESAFYLNLLLEPILAHPLKNAYLPAVNVEVATALEGSKVTTEVMETKSSAYPMVQPMKAALYFDNADGFGEWRILIGTDAIKKLREFTNTDKKKCAIVVKKIKQLSNGHFSEDNQKRLNGSFGVPIFEAKMQRDLRLVYQVDVVADHDGEVRSYFILVIKIYGIYTHTQLNRIWDAMGQHLAGKGKEYRRRCIYRNPPAHLGDNVYLPASFPPEITHVDTKPTALVLSDKDMGQLHSLLVLEKYVTFSQVSQATSLIANQDVQHVFELTPEERKIIECKTSCYVLGRSGTGKTTTMLFKMLGIQRAWEMQSSGMPKPRQIFVTKSRVLASKVEEYFSKLLESLALAGYSLEDLKKMKARNTEGGLIDLDDVPEDQSSIPQRYSALEDKHFPLFVTFEKVWQWYNGLLFWSQFTKMVAADVLSGDDPDVQRAAKLFINTDNVEAQDSFVSYEVFARVYWPHFPQHLTKGVEPWLVFSEFMGEFHLGIIKGSEKSLTCPERFLEEKMYCSLPPRSHPTFANQRQIIFTLFEAYCKLKRQRRHHDVADRTHAILKALLGGAPLKGQRVDYLYVDEAQDNLLIDALLLRLICRNPEGLFWAGDTAQTISAGSSFRFDDLKAFLYRIEQDQSDHLIQERAVTDPTAFQLAINYRSHGGIVNCAHTVIERITCLWPDAIDGLQPEHGIVDGLKPVFFHGWDKDTVRYEQFLFGESGSHIEFGAQQCILVRDDEARDKLREQVGDIGLIMTLYESKGLEFNDVLLYNFFEDSAVDLSRWRVLLNYTEGEVDGQDLSKVHAPSFERDEGRFAGVCSELKLLYVGITRARKNMWIVDKSEKSEPMRMIWTSRDQVQNCTPGTDVPHLADSGSSNAEWESSGRNLFKHKRYPQAMHCFSRASLPRMVAICKAFHLREIANSKVDIAPRKDQQQAFLVAADAFMTSGNDAPAGTDKLQYYRNAAKCYVQAGDDRKAAIAYLAAQEYDLAARQYRKAGLFDETLGIIHKYSQSIPSESTEELYMVCRLFYYSKSNKPPLPLFSSFESELEFLEDYDLDFARASLFESHGRYLEAAELHLTENRPLDAISDFLKVKESRDAITRATDILLEGLWRRCSFGIPSKEVAGDQDVIQFLALARELPMDLLDPFARDEIRMFQAIAKADFPNLDKLALTFLEKGQNASALLALDHIFGRLPVLKSAKLADMSAFLAKFLRYAHLIHQVTAHADPLSSNSLKRLFCISEVSSTEYGMEIGSFLHSCATGDRHGPMYLQPSRVTLSRSDMVSALRKYLAEHLCERVTAENELCFDAVVFSQCLPFIVNGHCNRIGCPQDHINLSALDTKQYNTRVRIHLQQICILQTMYSANPHLRTGRQDCVLDWLSHLYEAFNPQFHVQGSAADLDLSMMPGGHESIRVMKHWVREALYNLNPNQDRPGFLTAVLKLTSLVIAFDRSGALKCINQAPFNTRYVKPPHFLYTDGRYLVEDIVNLFDGVAQTCISSGILFLRHILRNSLFANLSVLCDCLEEVVGKIAVSWRLSYVPALHGLILPRGWLSSNKDFSNRKDVQIVLVVDLLDSVRGLLMRLQSGSASGEEWFACDSPVVAYNITNLQVKNKVESILAGLRTAGVAQRANPLYRKSVDYVARWYCPSYLTSRYAYARRHEYLKVMADYDDNVVITDLVHLVHKRGDPRLPQVSPRIKQILYENPEDIPNLLASQLVAARSDLRADAQPFIPQPAYVSQAEVTEDPREDDIQLEGPDSFPEPTDEMHEEPQELPPVTDEPALIHGHDPTEEDIFAAQKIQAAFRTYRRHRDILARAVGSGAKAERNMVFVACLKNVYASSWQQTCYRRSYLWALPHLVVCLDRAIAIAHEFKGKTKGLLSKESHERLEELGRQRSEITRVHQLAEIDGHNLRKEIEPNATMHQRRDIEALKKALFDVKDFISRLPTAALELQDDLQTAYKFIAVEKQVAKPQKPILNTEDLDFY
ncbi:hypothetical protein BU15DRAFT_43965 [Melanogaster broomeanus]|nr:hypothetical protein BU15DRAFT_43965 [Melanogaster broomeanus]